MRKEQFRFKVTAETWKVLLACQRHLDEKVKGGAKVPPLCICCPDTSGGQVFALWEAGKDCRWTTKKPTDWKWTHHTLRALEARMREEVQGLMDEQMIRTAALLGQGIVMAAKQLLVEAEEAFYKNVIHAKELGPKKPRVKKEKIKVAKAMTLQEVKAAITKAGGREDIISLAISMDAMEGVREGQFDRIVSLGVQYGALINNAGWLSLPEKEE